MTGIQYFEPRPPKVAALQLDPEWSVAERIEKLRMFPGVDEVAVKARGGTRIDDDVLVLVQPYEGCGDLITLTEESSGWLVAIITETTDESRVEVKRVGDNTLTRVYQPRSRLAARAKASPPWHRAGP